MKSCNSDSCRIRFKRGPAEDREGDQQLLIVDSSPTREEESIPRANFDPSAKDPHSMCLKKILYGFRMFQPQELDKNFDQACSRFGFKDTCGACTMFPSCMSLLSRRQDPRPPKPGQTPVVLNVYDMYWTNWYTAGAGLGVYHSGVQVHGAEWAYGGHPYAFTGVFDITPRDAHELGEQFRFRQSVHVGYTDFTADEVRRLVGELGKQFRGDKYHLMNNNCNHFTSAFCQALCNNDIPAWVNRLAYVSSCVPFLQRCLPKEWLTPAALQQSLAAHSRSSSPQTPQ